ncbi:MAG: hypothetical protein LQ342_004758 [Letrouitia transgressa]|nr:MAG: hypothetical protein LQ342_004758 [Letrouitia transgressa]
MRFGPPSTPTPGVTPNDPKGFIQCHNVSLGNAKDGLGVPFPGKPNAGANPNNITQTEDCLFLDIYVPKSVLDSRPLVANVPTIVWFYGGGFVSGAKNGPGVNNPLYTGLGALNSAKSFNKDVIFVAGNYRLGAFGWLAGSYMEKHGLPNAGLADQRLLLQWVQNHIYKVGGDKTQVSAWGESAGAGSILHHLVMNDGKQDPYFSKAMLQSPGFQIQWDREGTVNDTYTGFATSVPGCPSGDITCLRKLPIDDGSLTQANVEYATSYRVKTGQIPFGPAADGSVIKHLPANEFLGKLYNRNIKSLLVSHVGDEAEIFVPDFATADARFTTFVSNFMPQQALSTQRNDIYNQYSKQKFPLVKDRFKAVIRDGSFTCNTRQLFDAYRATSTSTYMLYYNINYEYWGIQIFPPVHAIDLLPLFRNPEIDYEAFLIDLVKQLGKWDWRFKYVAPKAAKFYAEFAPKYQSYLVAHAIFGDPNLGSFKGFPWPTATYTASSTSVSGVQQATVPTPSFHIVADEINTSANCDFWAKIAAQIDPVGNDKAVPELENVTVGEVGEEGKVEL